ncbi:MAG TPA: hypothetical protein VLR92_00730 [Blastocatellia bacterium]|nr:hypothetical protein [Blastocatellia bacterium]
MRSLFLHACAILITLPEMTFGQQSAPLRVTLSFDQTTYALNSETVIEVRLTNPSRRPVFVYSNMGWGESASLSIWFKDAATGKDIAEDTALHDSITPPPTSSDDFVKLLPGHIYGRSIRSSIAQLNIARKGTYEVVAEYHSPVSRGYAFGLPIWSREDGTLVSNRATLKVE